MKLSLDECVPQRLKHDFPEHNVSTVAELGLCGLKNGELLRAVAEEFNVLITVDRGMQFQQNLASFDLALIILIAKPCRYPQLKLLVPRVHQFWIRSNPVLLLRFSGSPLRRLDSKCLLATNLTIRMVAATLDERFVSD